MANPTYAYYCCNCGEHTLDDEPCLCQRDPLWFEKLLEAGRDGEED
jgi:hypothetical protein